MISFLEKPTSIVILRNNRPVFEIKNGDSLLTVGIGSKDYSMSHGSFKIKEHSQMSLDLTVSDITVNDDTATVELSKGKMFIEIVSGKMLKVSFDGLDSYNRMSFNLPADIDESVYGTGEIFTEFNLRNKTANVWVAEHINAMQIAKKLVKQVFGVKNTTKKQPFGKYETYYAQPTFVSSRKYFYHSTTTAASKFEFGKDYFHISHDEICPFYIGFGDDFEEVMNLLTSVVGRQPTLPEWVYDGQILGIQGGTDILMKKVNTALESGIPVAGAWIQDWEGRRVTAAGKQLYWNWEWDKELYPDLPNKIKELNAKGVKVLGYCNTFLAVEKPLYKEATEKGYCVKDKDGKDYLVTITTFPAAMVDLTNPDAYEWIKNIIKKNMIEFGLSGWMADFGEYLPTDCVLYSGENPELVHNTWGSLWAKVNREAIEEAGKLGEVMFFTRSGFSDTPKYSTLMWCGDNHVDFSLDFGLPSVIPAMLSLTLCGFGLSHSDIGGYTSIFNLKRSPDLFMRWCEMNAFSPVLRGHEGLNPDVNAQFDASEEVLEHGAKMSSIHKKLKNYLMNADKYNSETGVGVVRPLFFYYDEERAYNEGYEYLLGRDILVAPVLEQGAESRNVYLPNDEWVHIWTGKVYNGGEYKISAGIGYPPVFIRKSAQNVLDIFNL